MFPDLDLIESKIEKITDFRPGEVYTLIAIARTKYNPAIGNKDNDHNSHAVFRHPVRKDNVRSVVNRMLGMMRFYYADEHIRPEDFNLYISFNPRSVSKAACLLQQRMAEWARDGELTDRCTALEGYWVSCLQKPESRSRKIWYMLDIDNKDHYDDAMQLLESVRGHRGRVETLNSRNGYHVLVPPFDVHGYMKLVSDHELEVEVKTDSLVNLWCGPWDTDIHRPSYEEGYTEAISDLHRGYYEGWVTEVEGDYEDMCEKILGGL